MPKPLSKYFNLFLTILIIFTISPTLSVSATDENYDVIIKGGTVIDGTGLKSYEADVAIKDGYIMKVGDLSKVTADEEIDATGLYVTPGFIDLHAHSVVSALKEAKSSLTQGVTTEIMNPDGGGPTNVNERFNLENDGLAINVGAYIGFNSVWKEVVGEQDRRATEDEIARMQDIVAENMEKGAAGVSAGLFYRPAYYATQDEVVEVVSAARDWRTNFPNHQRNENNEVIEATEETIAIGERSGLVPVVTHIKTMGPNNWGKSEDMIQLIDDANTRGVYTVADLYPYLRSQTGLTAIVPPWVEDGGRQEMLKRFADPELRPQIEKEIEEIMLSRVEGPEGVYFPTKRKTLADYMETGVGNDPTSRTLLAFLNFNHEDSFEFTIDEFKVIDGDGTTVFEYDFTGENGAQWSNEKFEELHSYPAGDVEYTLSEDMGFVKIAQRQQGNASAYGKVTPNMGFTEDSEAYMRFKVNELGNDNRMRLWIDTDNFSSGSSFPVNGYGIELRLSDNKIFLYERKDGRSKKLEEIDANLEEKNWFELKVSKKDDELLVKIWPSNESEPNDWDAIESITEREQNPTNISAGEATMQILESEGSLRTIYSFGHEDDYRRFLQHPNIAVASDGGATTATDVHPRRYGTQPRTLGKYVREEGLIDWETAIVKMTSLPATIIGLSDRGYIAEGMVADITIFDPETIRDLATFDKPKQYSVGIEHVIVNGQLALTNSELTDIKAGKAVRVESNMPSRPLSNQVNIDYKEHAVLVPFDTSEQSGESYLKATVEQNATDRKASGLLELFYEDSELTLKSDSFGRLQTFDNWISFTGTGTLNGDETVAFRVTIDGDDPTVDDRREVLTVDIAGKKQIKAFIDQKVVDKNKLQQKVDQVQKEFSDSEKYTYESWNTLINALEYAKQVLKDNSATQEDVDSALAKLIESIEGLEEIDQTPPQDDEKDKEDSFIDDDKNKAEKSTIDGEKGGEKTRIGKDGGKTLPKTASQIFNIILLGILLITLSILFYILHKRRLKRS